ncbi:MAG: Gfo/Idh/MocA family oxidoreductase [Chloroflexi bacterium]|nr:Gfo/Idh/MocA family oxidoreductase [Chloroflexota bacterium]
MGLRYMGRLLDQHAADTTIRAVCDISPEACAAAAHLFTDHGVEPPPQRLDFVSFLADFAGELDAALILTPHVYHFEQAAACLTAGLDVLLEKPMVMTSAEARHLIALRDQTHRLLVVGFQGGLSPQVRAAVRLIRSGEIGTLTGISATIWQNWREATAGKWRQQPDISGGGMFFDTGAHLLNTVCDLAGEPFIEISAWLDHLNAPVEVNSAIQGRLASGALVTLHSNGFTIPPKQSEILVFGTEAVLRTGAWGERLDLWRRGRTRFRKVAVPASSGPWQEFLRIRRGEIDNPTPPEIGLRMALLWDAIQASAGQGGTPVRVGAP